MAKRCTRCGNFLMDDERFCTRCGENVSSAETIAAASQPLIPPANQQTQQPASPYGYGAPQGTYPNQTYTYGQRPAVQEEMTLGKWVLTIIVTSFFGLISLVFLFIWGFGDGPESRKNYCKAMLIVQVISVILSVIVFVIWIGMLSAMAPQFEEFFDEFEDYIEYGQYTAASLFSMLG